METERILSRSELYALVWCRPVQQVAADIGVSGVAVAKACRRHNIPVPGRGAWARRRHGHHVEQVPLPALPGAADPAIFFHPTSPADEPTAAAAAEMEVERRPENRIVVLEACAQLHPAVRRTRVALEKHKTDHHGLLCTRAKDCFNVGVSPEQVDRVCRILQALVIAFEKRGHNLVEGDESRRGLGVDVQGEILGLSIAERIARQPHVPGERDDPHPEADTGWSIPGQYEWRPTGRLTLQIPNSPRPRSRWGDRGKVPLEERLNEVTAALTESAAIRKQQHEDAEREQTTRADDARRREEAKAKAELDRARFRRLEHLARLWRRRETVEAFLAAVKERMTDAREELVPSAQHWVDWAEAYLDRHRPADVLFFEKLPEPGSQGFYRWAGGYAERDEWSEEWG